MKQYEIYLAGPMKGLTWKEANKWRKRMSFSLSPKIHTLSPLRACEINNQPIDSAEDDLIKNTEAINIRDYNDVKRCDLVLVNLLDAHEKSVGTIMEIAWAQVLRKPIVIIFDGGEDNAHNHPMLLYNAMLCKTLQEAKFVVEAVLLTDQERMDEL